MRFWTSVPTPAVVATTLIDVAGLYLQPVDSAAGVLSRGMLQPTWNSGSLVSARFFFSAVNAEAVIAGPTSVVGSIAPLGPALQHIRGVMPQVGASMIQLDLMIGGKQTAVGAPTGEPPLRSEPHYAQVSVRYRPRFGFMKGI